MVTIIEGNVNPKFRSREKETLGVWVFANRAQECRCGQAGCDQLPGRSIVARAVEIWRLIVEACAIDGDIGDAGIEVGRLDHRDFAPLAHVWRGYVDPILAVIDGHVD